MNPYIEKLKAFLSEQGPNFKYNDAESILEVLHCYYTSDHPIDSAVIRCQFQQLDGIYNRLTLDEGDILFRVVSDLCAEHERKAFIEGIKVGALLLQELSEA